MKKLIKRIVLLGVGLVGLVGFAAPQYPVDNDIAELQSKIDYLETLKTTFEKNRCAIEVDGNRVGLVPGALRSEGLVMAIGSKFPGNYLAYHKAPKPQFLRNVVLYTVKKPGAGDDAVIIGTRLGYQGATPTQLVVFVAKPIKVKGADNLWLYQKHYLQTALPEPGVAADVKGLMKDGRKIRLTCN